jgi:hypothetical protein
MISRLSAAAALFSVLVTASLAFAADIHQSVAVTQAGKSPAQVVQLERVVVTAKRLSAESR